VGKYTSKYQDLTNTTPTRQNLPSKNRVIVKSITLFQLFVFPLGKNCLAEVRISGKTAWRGKKKYGSKNNCSECENPGITQVEGKGKAQRRIT